MKWIQKLIVIGQEKRGSKMHEVNFNLTKAQIKKLENLFALVKADHFVDSNTFGAGSVFIQADSEGKAIAVYLPFKVALCVQTIVVNSPELYE